MDTAAGLGKLHISIGSLPRTIQQSGKDHVSLNDELQMVKAALLYSDMATLYSASASVIMELVSIRTLPSNKRIEFLKRIQEWFPEDESIQLLTTLIYLAEQQQDQSAKKEFSKAIDEAWEEMKKFVDSHIKAMDGDGIMLAKSSGFLEIHAFDATLRRVTLESEQRGLIMEYIGLVSQSIKETSVYPLFDEETNKLINAGVQAGIFSTGAAATAHAKEVHLAADLFARLPLFPLATMKETLNIRRELRPHLKRFRSAMIKFSEAIKSAAWDADFPFDAEQVFRRDVEPTICTLEEEVRSNRFILELTRKMLDRSLLPGGAAITLALSNLPISKIATLTTAGIVATGSALYDTYKEWAKKNRELQQNSLYLYYKAFNRLK